MIPSNLWRVRGVSAFLLPLVHLVACAPSEGSPPPGGGSANGGGVNASNAAGTGVSAGSNSVGGAGGAGGAHSANGGASAGSAGMPEPRGPTAATATAKFPFPQNRHSSLCSYPNYRNSDVTAAYERWKTDTVTSNGAGGFLRVQRPQDPSLDPNSTVSEGIGYGMLIAVYMNDQTLFDGLWKYEQQYLGKNGLMDWYISADGATRLGMGAASDGDEDMAWALVMADRQWGGKGSLSDTYLNVAKHQIELVYNNEIFQDKLLKPGDGWGDWSTVNASYFAPSYYRVFATLSGNNKWNDVIKTAYDTLGKTLNSANGNSENGLVPAWATSDGVPNSKVFLDHPAPTNYQYDSCRTPFRIGLDYCFNAEPLAQAYVQKTSQFFAGVGAKNIVDGYNLNGSPLPENKTGQSAAFVGPATVGAMNSAANNAFIQGGYEDIATLNLLVGGHYYDESWTVLSLLMLTGNFLDYTAQTPLVK
ncbi:MAG: glycosyl hydrolase family 8 [Pseudomonadota bacterium]